MAQQVASYPAGYLDPPVTNTRLLETVEQLEEDLWDRASIHRPLHVVLQVGPAIEVSDARLPKDGQDPLLLQLQSSLEQMLQELAHEAETLASGERRAWVLSDLDAAAQSIR